MLFADDAAETTHTHQDLQALMDRFSQASKDFGQTINFKKTNALGQLNCQRSPSMTMSSMSLNSSHILAPPSLTTSRWTLRLTRGMGRQLQHLFASLTSVDQPQIDSEDQDGSAHCLCRQYTDVRQGDVDHILCQTGEKTQLLPPEKHPGVIALCARVPSCVQPVAERRPLTHHLNHLYIIVLWHKTPNEVWNMLSDSFHII